MGQRRSLVWHNVSRFRIGLLFALFRSLFHILYKILYNLVIENKKTYIFIHYCIDFSVEPSLFHMKFFYALFRVLQYSFAQKYVISKQMFHCLASSRIWATPTAKVIWRELVDKISLKHWLTHFLPWYTNPMLSLENSMVCCFKNWCILKKHIISKLKLCRFVDSVGLMCNPLLSPHVLWTVWCMRSCSTLHPLHSTTPYHHCIHTTASHHCITLVHQHPITAHSTTPHHHAISSRPIYVITFL